MLKHFCFVVLLFFIDIVLAYPQNSYSLYFYPENPLAGNINPAKIFNKGRYFGIPLLSPLNLSLYSSNISYNDFIAKDPAHGDSLMIKKESLNQMGADNMLFLEIRKPIIVYGWGTSKQAFEFQLGLNGYTKLDFSKNLAALLLDGNEQFINKEVTFNKERMEMNSYGTISMGYRYKFSEVFFAGIRLKALFGLANIHTKNMEFSMLTDNEEFKTNIYSNIVLQTAGIGNMFKNRGIATDLGITYLIPNHGIELSAALDDLGFIRWKDKVSVITSSTKGKVFEFKGITGLYSQSIQEITDSLQNQFDISTSKGGKYTTILPVKLVVSASYCPHQNGEIGIIYMQNFGVSFTSLVYTMPMNSWLRLSVSNTSHSGDLVNPGFGFEVDYKSFQCFGTFEDVDSFWLNRTKNINLNMGMNIFLNKKKADSKIPGGI